MNVVARVRISHMNVIILVIPHCASSLPGNLGTQGYRFHLLQDVTDQVCDMLTSGDHVP